MGRGVVVVAALAACCAAPAAPARAAPPTGKLVTVGESFVNSRDRSKDGLYVLNADGTGLRQLTRSVADEQPHWSPDGTTIAFVRGEDPSTVQVMGADGSGRRALGRGDSLESPTPWSPDGRRLAWGGCGGLCVADISTGARHGIPFADAVFGFAWSPDGTALAAAAPSGLVVVPAAGPAPRTLYPGNVRDPAWSPDGSTIAFVENGTDALTVIPAAGGSPRVLARGAYRPAWSADGRSILFTAGHAASILDVASGRVRVIAGQISADSWSPDGTAIVGERYDPAGTELWTVSTDGTSAEESTAAFPTGASYAAADWTVGSVPAVAPTPLLHLRPAAEQLTPWVDELAPAADGVVFAHVGALCNLDAETTASVFFDWSIGGNAVERTATPCGDFDGWAGFARTAGVMVWAGRRILSVDDYRNFVAASPVGRLFAESIRWNADSYDRRIGRVAGMGPVVGDGALAVFETWNLSKRLAPVHRRLWRIVARPSIHLAGRPLPPGVDEVVGVDHGRVLAGATGGVAVLDDRGRVLRRIRVAHAEGAAIGGGEIAVRSGVTLRVFAAVSGRLLETLPLASDAGLPALRSVRGDVAVYTSGVAVHVLRLHDGLDQVLDLPRQGNTVDALLTARGLFVAYDEPYVAPAGHVLFVPAPALP